MQRRGKLLVLSNRDQFFLGGVFSFFRISILNQEYDPLFVRARLWNVKFQRFL